MDFQLSGLDPGEYVALATTLPEEAARSLLQAVIHNMEQAVGEPSLPDNMPLVVVRPAQTTDVSLPLLGVASIAGQVLVAGVPEPQGSVALLRRPDSATETWHLVRRVQCDANGTYSLSSLPAGAYLVVATAPNAATPRWKLVQLAAGDALTRNLTFHGLSVSGTVIHNAGTPAEGAVISLTHLFVNTQTVAASAALASARPTLDAVPTDEWGRFRLGYLEPGTYRVTARGGGWLQGPPVDFEVSDTDAPELRVLVNAGAVVWGSVTLPGGHPAIGDYSVELFSSERNGVVSSQLLDQGTYRLESILPGSYDLQVYDIAAGRKLVANDSLLLREGDQMQVDLIAR